MAISLNPAGESNARSMISHGKVSGGSFSFDKADRDEMLGPNGTDVAHLAAHHLGVDDTGDQGDSRSYRYPFAKGGQVYSRALESIANRAADNGHDAIRAAADDLSKLIADPDDDGDDDTGGGDDTDKDSNSAPHSHVERRCLMVGIELRAAPDGARSPGTVVGYAAVFNKFSQDLGYFREKIVPGAFSGAIKTSDVRALRNHEPDNLLGRSTAGTLRMVEDELGLRVEIDLPDTQVGRDTATEIGRRDMDGMSFSFDTEVDSWDYSGETPIRTLIKVRNLYDVGPVTYPAYTDTSVAMRSMERCRPVRTPSAPLQRLWARQRLAEATLIPS